MEVFTDKRMQDLALSYAIILKRNLFLFPSVLLKKPEIQHRSRKHADQYGLKNSIDVGKLEQILSPVSERGR